MKTDVLISISTERLADSAASGTSGADPRLGGAASARRGPRRRTLILWSLLLLAGTAALTIWWYAGLRNRFFPDNFAVVEAGRIYRSAQIDRHIIRKTLTRNQIGLIIDLSSENTEDAKAEEKAAADLGIERVTLTLRGNGVGNPAIYPQAIEKIVEANRGGKAVLVHCQSGAQRTSGIIATYRILVQGRSESEAFAEAERYGHNPRRNPSLIPFVEKHLPEWKEQLAADHVIPVTQPQSVAH